MEKTALIETVPWQPTNLTNLLSSALAQHQHLRCLLTDDCVYLLDQPWPEVIARTDRTAIFNLVANQIPEEIQDSDWDYQQVELDSQLRLLAFAPVQSIISPLIKTCQELDVTIDAIEPTALAAARHPDPVIGLALKTDLDGQDSATLNLSTTSDSIGSKQWLIWLFAVIIILIISSVATVALFR